MCDGARAGCSLVVLCLGDLAGSFGQAPSLASSESITIHLFLRPCSRDRLNSDAVRRTSFVCGSALDYLSTSDGAPHVICTSYHDFLDGAQLSCLILRHLLDSFLYSVEGPVCGFHFSSESFFGIFPVSTFGRKECLFIILGVQSVSLQHFTCSRYSLTGDSCCHWPCTPALPFCFSFLSNLFTLNLSGENIPTFLVCTVLFPSFAIAFHDAPFSSQTYPTATLSMVCPLLPPETCCNIAGINFSCMFPHLPLSPWTETARS